MNSHSSGIDVAIDLKQPTREPCGPHVVLLFGLAPSGVYLAATVTSNAVRSYRTIQPYRPLTRRRRYIFCCTCRRLTPPRSYLAPCPLEPGLSSLPEGRATVWSTLAAKDIAIGRKNNLFIWINRHSQPASLIIALYY